MFRAVKNRCFVDFDSFVPHASKKEASDLLHEKGFKIVQVDLAAEARQWIGRSAFKLGAKMKEAPKTVDCSVFTKWLYGRKGIWIPRLAVQQFGVGINVKHDDLQSGDLIFTSGYCPRAWHIGHVSLFTGSSVVTAMIQGHKSGVIEISLEGLLRQRKLRGIRRIIPESEHAATIIVPRIFDIETSDDIRYLVLSWLSCEPFMCG